MYIKYMYTITINAYTRARTFPCYMLIHVKHRGAQPNIFIYWAQERLGIHPKRHKKVFFC